MQAKMAVIDYFRHFWINNLATFFAITLLDDISGNKKSQWNYVFRVSFSCLLEFTAPFGAQG